MEMYDPAVEESILFTHQKQPPSQYQQQWVVTESS